MTDSTWFYIFASLLLVAVFGYLVWRDWKDRRGVEIDIDADEFQEALQDALDKSEEREDERLNWIASMAMAIVLVQKDVARIADKMDGSDNVHYGTTGDTTEDRKQSLYEEGIQNILNYGMEQMRNRGDVN